MKNRNLIILIFLTLLLFSIILLGLKPSLINNLQIFGFAILIVALSLLGLVKIVEGEFRGLRGAKGRNLALVGLILGIIDVGVPYFILKNTVKFWANYLFWTVLTLIVLVLGLWQINKWGENE